MGWFEVTFIYIVSWWMILLMLLPIKAGAAAEASGKHEYYSAPKKSYMKQKMLASAVLSAIFTGLLAYLIDNGVIVLWLPQRF